MAASSSSPPTLTIEEANRKSGMRRAGFWFCAVYVLPLCIGVASFLAYDFHRNDHIFPRSAPWRPTAVVAWGVHMALVMELFFFMSLYLPRAPVALRDAVVNVGVGCVGVPLGWIVILAACLGGHTWMCVVLAFVFAVVFTAVLALWVWLVRTYT